MSKYGFVYALSNPSMPGIFKIGFTMKHPRERMAELSRATACPTPFELISFFDVDDPEHSERDIHAQLNEFRVSNAREFFRCSAEHVQDQFRQWADTGSGVFYSELLDTLVDIENFHGPSRRIEGQVLVPRTVQ
jgi:hypothetical protein